MKGKKGGGIRGRREAENRRRMEISRGKKKEEIRRERNKGRRCGGKGKKEGGRR